MMPLLILSFLFAKRLEKTLIDVRREKDSFSRKSKVVKGTKSFVTFEPTAE